MEAIADYMNSKVETRLNVISHICVLERQRQALIDQQPHHRDYETLGLVTAKIAELKRSIEGDGGKVGK